MDISATVDAARDELYKVNLTFRNLVHKHRDYEKRLDELANLNYPSDDELTEETTLKKKKLLLKDEIQNMLQKHSESH